MRARGVVWMTAGAAAALLFDPSEGRRRRAALRDRARSRLHRAERWAAREARHRLHDTTGAVRRQIATHRNRAAEYDDRTLEAKIRSEAFRGSRIPKGQVLLVVNGGAVTLRGELPDAQLAAEAARRVRRVPGVRSVENQLHTVRPVSPAGGMAVDRPPLESLLHRHELDDVELANKVRSLLFRQMPGLKGQISVDAAEGVVTVRGAVGAPRLVGEAETIVRRIAGVRGVHNRLHPAGTPAPDRDR
jgi:osmotically-inducible protein OsmY